MRDKPYAGPSDTNDFDGLDPDAAGKLMHQYRLLGDCFELSDDDDMMGRGFLIEDWESLLESKQTNLARAQRELAAAVKLARHEGAVWYEIAELLGITEEETRTRYAQN